MAEREDSGSRTLLRAVIGAACVWLGLATVTAGGAEPKLHDAALSAEKMAAILLGRTGGRTRSIEMKPEAEAGRKPDPGILAFMVHFDLDSDWIDPVDHQLLDEVGRLFTLPEMEGRALVVEGHTDARGAGAYNDALSQRRANAVASYLVERHAIAPERLLPVGRGERELLDRNDPTASGNRRVQFYLPGAK